MKKMYPLGVDDKPVGYTVGNLKKILNTAKITIKSSSHPTKKVIST